MCYVNLSSCVLIFNRNVKIHINVCCLHLFNLYILLMLSGGLFKCFEVLCSMLLNVWYQTVVIV